MLLLIFEGLALAAINDGGAIQAASIDDEALFELLLDLPRPLEITFLRSAKKNQSDLDGGFQDGQGARLGNEHRNESINSANS